MFGTELDTFVPADKVTDVCLAVIEIFRDKGNRDTRVRGRMKFLVQDMGAEKLRAEIIKRLGYDLENAGDSPLVPETFRDHVGIVGQKEPGLYSLGFSTSSGRITPEDLFVAADIAERCGSGVLFNSCAQNLLVPDVSEERLEQARDMALNAPTMTLRATPIRAGMIVCTGMEFCNMAMAETKNRSFDLLDYLEKEVSLDVPIKISISGCAHSCSQHQVADIGLRGRKINVGDELLEAFDIFVGCQTGIEPEMGRCVKKPSSLRKSAWKLPTC